MPEFSTREGADNPGFDYEKDIAALFAVRYAFDESVHDFWIATNVDCVGDTDDVVLCVTPVNGEPIAFLLQLKHENPTGDAKTFKDADFTYLMKDSRRDKKKERFSVDKYSRGYKKFRKHLTTLEGQSALMQSLRLVNNFAYILYTNRKLKEKLNCLVDADETAIFKHLNTSKSTFYGFNTEFFNLDEDFLRNLYLYSNQVSFEEVFNLIKAELRKRFGSHKFARADFDDVTKRYLEIIKLWIKGCEFEKGIKYISLSKRNVLNILSDILLESYKYDIEDEFSHYDCLQKNIWNNLMSSKDISIVYSDDLTLQFLKDYIGSEVKLSTKKQAKYWKMEVSKWASNALRDEIPDDQVQMMKICGYTINDCITMASIYKFMWFYKNLPLLLEINTEKEYLDILKILKITKYKIKVIVITSDQNFICRKINQVKQFSSLKDLTLSEKSEILKLTVQFQGRISVPLAEIAKESWHGNLKCADIIHILCNDFNIGNKFEFGCKCYIPRNVSKILISCEALVKIENEFFLIEAENKMECVNFLMEELAAPSGFNINDNSQICIMESDSVISKDVEKLKTAHDCFHRLLFHEGFLEWRESTGSVANIVKFQIDDKISSTKILYDDVCGLINNVDTNKFQIISACPGMGKSVLLNYVTCFATSCVWIIPVTLRDIAENDEIEDPSDFFTFYLDQLLSEDSTMKNMEFSKLVFKDMVERKKVLLLLDGFDEVSILHKDKFTSLLSFLHKEQYPVLIATREHMKLFLENNFNVPSRSLKPFTFQEQQLFLTNFFKLNIAIKNEKSNSILLEFVQQLLNAAKQNMSCRDEQFTGIPLQLQLLANNFLKECKTSINNSNVCLDTKFDLLDLYEKFIKNKTAILCEKYGASEKQWLKSLENIQYLFALKYLFDEECTKDLDIESKLEQYCEDEEYTSQLMQKEGILTFKWVQNKMSVDFIHRTFAEYLSAQWLTKNIKNSKFKETVAAVIHLRFEQPEYCQFLFVIFDRILAKQCTFHLDIINLKVDDIKLKLVANPKMLSKTDETNRTALHMLSLYANEYTDEDLKAILNTNVENWELAILDNLSYSALDYALLSRSWTVANKLCELSQYLRMKNVTESYFYIKNLSSKYKFLFLTVFHNHLCRDILIGEIGEKTSIYDYTRKLLYNTYLVKELYKYVRNVYTAGEYLTYCGIKDPTKNYYTDVRFAIAFGTIENFEYLFKSSKFNIDDKDCSNDHTLLKYATIYKRTGIVKILLNKGADVNISGRDGDTAVHDAARHGCDDILEMFINSNADLNIENGCDETPLEVAILKKNTNVIRLLLKHNAGISCPMFVLHDIVEIGDTELLLKFLQKGFDINEKTGSGITPLHTALENNRIDLAKILIDHNCDFRSDTATTSLLHLVAKIGDVELLNVFLDAGLDVNKQNIVGVTPLMIAIENKHFDLASILIANNADVLAKCGYGDVLSVAISHGNEEILLELIQKGCDVNRRDVHGNTPLLSALEERKLNIAILLMQQNADVHVKNNIGYTTVHYAAMNGYKDLVVELLGYGVDLNRKTIYFDTALLLALKNKFVEIAKMLISEQAEVNGVNKEKSHSLHYAILSGDIEIVQELIASGAELNVQNSIGLTPLQLAISNDKLEIARLLLSCDADITITANNGNSTLHIAAIAGNNEVILNLLEKNCDIDQLGHLGRSSLLCALQHGKIETVRLLIQNFADITIKDAFLDSVLHFAAVIGCDDLVLELLSKGIDGTGRNLFGQTPLALALMHSNLSTAQLLFSKCSEIDTSVLHLAASSGYNELVIACLDKGFDINRPDCIGNLPIELAIMKNKFDTVKVLIEQGTVIPSMLSLILFVGIKAQSDFEIEDIMKYFKLLLDKYSNINWQDKYGNSILHYLCDSDLFKYPDNECKFSERLYREILGLLVHLGADFNIKNKDCKSAYKLAFEKNKIIALSVFNQN